MNQESFNLTWIEYLNQAEWLLISIEFKQQDQDLALRKLKKLTCQCILDQRKQWELDNISYLNLVTNNDLRKRTEI